jgi:large subunit ribosomal protein L6
MSRIGKKPISIPAGVKVSVSGRTVSVEGPKGKTSLEHRPEITVKVEGDQIIVERQDDERLSRGFHGLTRTLISNMVEGVTKGYERSLSIVGVGYNASVSGQTLNLNVGYADTRRLPIPQGLKVETPNPTTIRISGIDKQVVGHFAAFARSMRKPEPYKGKGIRYLDEVVKRKAGKAFAGAGG